MAQDVKLKIGADTSDFDRSIKKIQGDLDKLKTNTASKPAPGVESLRDAAQTNRNLTQRIREEKSGLDLINRELSKKKALIDQISAQQASAVKGSKEELELVRQLNREKERLFQTERIAQIQKTNYERTQESARKAMGIPNTTEPKANGMADFIKAAGGTAAIVGSIAMALRSGVEVFRGYGEAPISASVAQGSAMQGTFGRELQNIYSGRSVIENSFMDEKGKAAQLAVENLKNRQAYDTASIYTGIGTKILGGASAGGVIGSMAGGVGALPGALIGGGAAAVMGVGSALMDPRQRARMLGEVSPTFKAQYESMNAQEFGDNYQKAYEAERNKNPFKTLAAEDYQQNYLKNLDFQRSIGLNYQTFHGAGGFRENAINAGFTDQMGMGMSSSILQAGGGTGSARDLSTLGLQMQRGMNVTNAGNIIGALSGSIGSSATTGQATVRLLQEGVSLGLDSSKYAEENRRFLEVGAQFVAKSGTQTEAGVAAVIESMGRFFGADKTVQGIAAGAGAYEKYQEISTASTGPRGVLRAAGMLNSGMFKGLSAQDRMAISSIPDNELTPDDPRVQAIALKLHKDPQEIIDERKKVDSNAVFRTAYSQRAADRYSTIKGNPKASTESVEEAKNAAILAAQSEFPGMPRKQLESLVEGVTGNNRKVMGPDPVKAMLGGKETGKVEDTTVQGQAEASRVMLENFQKLGAQIAPTAEAVGKFNKKLQETVEIVMKMPEADRNNVFSKLFPSLYPKTQAQGGRPSGQ